MRAWRASRDTCLRKLVPFNPEVFAQAEARQKRKKLARLQQSAAALGLTFVPAQ